MANEPFGYGNRWWDRAERGRRIGYLVAGIGIAAAMIVALLR